MNKRLKFREKFAFGLGDFGQSFCFSFLASFALIYFTDIAGASAAAIGALLLVAKCFDGITDLFMGHLIDKTRAKMGKARPWLFWSAFPLAVSLVMIFNVPQSLSPVGKNIYIFTVYVFLCAFCYTASNISYSALMSLITDNADDRVSMGSIRFMCTAVAGIIIGSFTTLLIDAFGNGQKGWLAVAILYSAIFLLFTLITVFGVKELSGDDLPIEKEKKDSLPFLKSILYLLRNKYFVLTFFIFLTLYIFTGATGASGIYYATYILGNQNMYGLLSLAMMIPMFIALIFTPAITKRLGMRKTCILASILFAGGSLVITISGNNLIIVLAGIVIRSLGMGAMSALIFAFIAEAARYSNLRDGVSIEGMAYSCSSIGVKIGTGLGVAIVGWMLGLGRYDGAKTEQAASALKMIDASYKALPLVVGIVILLLFLPMNVEQENKRLSGRGNPQ